MVLRHERAALRGENLGGVPVTLGEPGQPLPNIDVAYPGGRAPSEGDGGSATPGLGALPPRWRAAREKVSGEGLSWVAGVREGRAGPAPDGFAFGFFNVAPRDQQLDRIPVGAPIVLENLTRTVPRFETRLPAVVPKVIYVEPATKRPLDVAMRCDTLWIDADREVAVVSWRGIVGIAPPVAHGLGTVMVAAHAPTEQVSYEDVVRLLAEPPPRPPSAALPPLHTGSVLDDITGPAEPSPLRAPLPFQKAPARAKHATQAMPVFTGAPAPATPFPLAEVGSGQRTPAEPIPGAPWAGPSAPLPVPDEGADATLIFQSPAEPLPPPEPPAPAPVPAKAPSAPPPPPVPAQAPSTPPPPPREDKPAPPAASPWRVEPPPEESPPPAVAPRPPPAPAPDPAVRRGLYEGFSKKR
jgi:hypothetical protein